MFSPRRLLQRWQRSYAPLLALMTLLQRSPAVRIIVTASEYVLNSSAGSLLKSAVAPLAALGMVDAMAGASSTPGVTYTYSLVTSPPRGSPYNVTLGTAIPNITFSIVAVPLQPAPQSWAIAGPMPPGLSFGSVDGTSVSGLTAGQSKLINVASPVLYGTPTQAGTYTMLLQAFQLQDGGGFYSSTFSYQVTVVASTLPTFASQPRSQTVLEGNRVTFSGIATATPTPTYQWLFNGTPLQGATSSILTLTNVTTAQAGNYTLVATNSIGAQNSDPATLTVVPLSTPPTVTMQPSSQTVATGATVVFTAAGTGTPAPGYQWTLNNTAIAGATDATLVVSHATATNAGSYVCQVTNSAGAVASSPATLAISTTQNVGRLVNISCRANVGTGGGVLIAGFVSGGNGTAGTQPVLIRATGPALVPFGVTGALVDPQLTLYTGDNPLATNAGWNGSAQITTADNAVGAFPLVDPTSKDSALYVPSLAAGGYSAKVAGSSGDTGVALAEVYDATPASAYTPTSPRIINISARVQVGTGGNILIAGFAVGGTTAKTLLVRASGPALAPFGVTGVLNDPILTLYDGSNNLIASNSSWGGNPAVTAVGRSVAAFEWTDPSSHDSALLITLPPGTYSAQVAGAAGTADDTGVALVEVYDIP